MQRKRTITPPTFLLNYSPLKVSVWKSCPLHNFETVKNIFIELRTNIKLYQMICREKEPLLYLHFLRNHAPLKFFIWKSRLLYNFKTLKAIFKKLGTNLNHHQIKCRGNNHNSTFNFRGMMPLWFFSNENLVRSITLKPSRIFSCTSVSWYK